MTKQTIQAEIIAVGTELLLGQITNTNASWIARRLAKSGVNVYHHSVAGDNLERLATLFQAAQDRSDVIIVTGGLGPTEDDLSREAFQKISGLPIVDEPHSMAKIEEFYRIKQVRMTENNRRQARVFKDSEVLENHVGMAPGNLVHYQGKMWAFLPGVPREMKQLFQDSVLPATQKKNGKQVIESTVLRFIGIGESVLEDRLQDLIQAQDNPTIAPLAQQDGVTVRLSAKASSPEAAWEKLSAVKQKILNIIGRYYFGSDDETLEQVVLTLLQQHSLTISAAESLTGGLFADKLVTQPGTSDVFTGGVVCYSKTVKEQILQVKSEITEEYGTVSKECAEALATNVKRVIPSDIGISFTGVAGPDKEEGREVGTVFIGLDLADQPVRVEHHQFHGDRQQIRYRAVLKGIEMLLRDLNQ